ncbi:MAG: YggS family pyridoxal phosphate-dependent enzyme [Phaeodactylibacter sp.]|uniref:YggS family pyridoxal phosphate-dependent enzyme n=1 Tax=Phaeodactylibacter sp. TaxID=1940289 RepID=UPI0032F0925D
MNFKELQEQLAQTKTTLVAVSKTKPNEKILSLYEQGQRDFGENRVQEMADKYAALPQDIRWHFIGHLQTNKVKYMAEFVHLVHSVDRQKILKEINKRAKQHDRVIDCLLQFHIAEEESKFGFDLAEAKGMLEAEAFKNFNNIRICGVMGMATFTEDEQKVRREFQALHKIFDTLHTNYFADQPHFREISMGMSGDYPIAQEEGSTMVRIGSLLFGPRT